MTYVDRSHRLEHVREGSSPFGPKIPSCAVSASRRPFVDKQENLNARCVLRKTRANPMSYVACVVSGSGPALALGSPGEGISVLIAPEHSVPG